MEHGKARASTGLVQTSCNDNLTRHTEAGRENGHILLAMGWSSAMPKRWHVFSDRPLDGLTESRGYMVYKQA